MHALIHIPIAVIFNLLLICGQVYSQDSRIEKIDLEIESLKENVGNASMWLLTPNNLEWSSFSWLQVEIKDLEAVKQAVRQSKTSNKAGEFYLLEGDKSSLDISKQGIIVFQIDKKIIGFRRRFCHISDSSLEVIDVNKFDPDNKKLSFSNDTKLHGIILPVSYKNFILSMKLKEKGKR